MGIDDKAKEISPEMAKRVCSHMNEDHAVSVYAMARSLLGDKVGKITEATMKNVSMTGCDIAVVTCSGEQCEMKRVTYPFEPPLSSPSEIRPRMVEIHREVCAPRISWLFTHADALVVLIVCALLGYATHVVGTDNLPEYIDAFPHVHDMIVTIFGSVETFGKAVRISWVFAVLAHTAEALYVVYHAKVTLKMGVKAQFLWYLLVSCVGYPITKEFLRLMKLRPPSTRDHKHFSFSAMMVSRPLLLLALLVIFIGMQFKLASGTFVHPYYLPPRRKSTHQGIHNKDTIIGTFLAAKRGASSAFSGGSKTSAKSNSSKKSPNNTKRDLSSKIKPQETRSAQTETSSSRSGSRAPPWQVLSKKNAKMNVEREKNRRERIQQGVPHYEAVDEPEEPLVISKTFLDNADQKFLGWKRFNPSTVPAGMKLVTSTLEKRMPPRLGVPEIAFLGRSNVGKSSLLNRLASSFLGTKSSNLNDMARVGKTPGATASVNLYGIYDKKERPILGFVDLPGFGYAKLSKNVKESVQQAAERYLGKRQELVLGILLVDIRRIPSDDDRAVLAALYDMGVPILVVATKVDKISKNEFDMQLEEIRVGLGLPDGQPFCASSVTGEGTKALWNLILEACETGVEAYQKKKLQSGQDGEQQEESLEDGLVEDTVYSQGYDWVHNGGIVYEDDDMIYYEDEGTDDIVEESFMESPRESLKSLKQKARRMERGGEV